MIVVRKGQAPHSNSSRARLAPDFSQRYRLKSGANHLWIHPEMKKEVTTMATVLRAGI